MFGIGETELFIIVVFGLLVFGPDKLPGMGRTVGRALRQFREAQEGFTKVVQTEVMDPLQDAMQEPSERRRRSFEEDADIDDASASGEASDRPETFAERKARLEAEQRAAQEASVTKAAAAEKSVAAAADDADAEGPKDAADETDDAAGAADGTGDAADAVANDASTGTGDASASDTAASSDADNASAAADVPRGESAASLYAGYSGKKN